MWAATGESPGQKARRAGAKWRARLGASAKFARVVGRWASSAMLSCVEVEHAELRIRRRGP
eukprot:11754060-Alexandrium_andersonii.AAC.1